MNRRDFALLVPAVLAGSAALAKDMEAEPLAQLSSGVFSAGSVHVAGPGRASQAFVTGMLAQGLRLEAHETVIEPGAPPEETRKHLHHEIWLMKEGSVELSADGVSHTMRQGDMGLVIAGTMHYVKNVGAARASYFVLAIGPPE